MAARRPADGRCARSTQTNHSCDWFKDEVRELGVTLGLLSTWPIATPFPGSGLGIRIPDEIKKEYTALLRQTDAISIEKLRSAIPP